MPYTLQGQPASLSREPRSQMGQTYVPLDELVRGRAGPDNERGATMEKRFLAALTLVGVIAALALPAGAKSKPHVRMKQYTSEHGARLHRHRAHQPAQRHARMQRYAAGHRARQHLKAQRQGE